MKSAFKVFISTLFLPSVAMAIELGGPAPEFSAPNQDGKVIRLNEFRGSPVLLYFYPKDDTPGCTKEACNFRDDYSKFKKAGAIILGVSRQDEASHQKFKQKHHIPFDFLVDKDGSIAKLYGVDTMPLVGFHKRQSFLIDRDGKIKKIYKDVNPNHHAEEVLKDLMN